MTDIVEKPNITINARKYDGAIHRTWDAKLLRRDNDLLIFVGEFDRNFQHSDLGVIKQGTLSYEYYWLDRWYNVFRFHEPNGDFRNFYCNVNIPPTFKDNVLDYVDLDIDLLVGAGRNKTVLDLEEFQRNSETFGYPDEVVKLAHESIRTLESMVDKREFPFDFTF